MSIVQLLNSILYCSLQELRHTLCKGHWHHILEHGSTLYRRKHSTERKQEIPVEDLSCAMYNNPYDNTTWWHRAM
jgi:hypothetical protein